MGLHDEADDHGKDDDQRKDEHVGVANGLPDIAGGTAFTPVAHQEGELTFVGLTAEEFVGAVSDDQLRVGDDRRLSPGILWFGLGHLGAGLGVLTVAPTHPRGPPNSTVRAPRVSTRAGSWLAITIARP